MSVETTSKLPKQWYAFVQGLTRLYEETGFLIDEGCKELYTPKGINGQHFFPLPIWKESSPDDRESYVGEYLSPQEIERRENEAERKAAEDMERVEFERLKAKFSGKTL